MTSGEITSIATVLVTFLAWLGYSIDPQIIQTGIMGLVSFIGLLTALWTAYKHNQAVSQQA